ncbi:MAG: BON domain-containing protein [Hydrogenovibrio crunogenus]|nr:BON domain-containing protein [Hydrogenovibrio crunogenus]
MRTFLMICAALALGACASDQSEPVVVNDNVTAGGAGAMADGLGPMQEGPTFHVTTEEEIADEVHEGRGDEGLDASAISVRVDGTSVWLSGRVRDGAEWERAIAIADDVEGVETVDASELFYD